MAISLAYAAMLCGRQDRVIHWLDVCDATDTGDATIEGWHSFRAAALRLRATFGLPEAESARSVEVARRAVELETAGGVAGHPTVHTALGAALTRDGRFDEGIAILLRTWQSDRTNWRPWDVLQVAGSLAISLAESGRGAECDRVLQDVAALAASVERDGREAAIPGLSSLRTAAGRRRYQQGDAEGAVALLRRGVGYAELHPRPLILVMALIYLADAELACGRRPAAWAARARAREATDDEPVSAFAMRRLADAETRLGRQAARTAVRAGMLHEELTDRELSVLRALPPGRQGQLAWADRLARVGARGRVDLQHVLETPLLQAEPELGGIAATGVTDHRQLPQPPQRLRRLAQGPGRGAHVRDRARRAGPVPRLLFGRLNLSAGILRNFLFAGVAG